MVPAHETLRHTHMMHKERATSATQPSPGTAGLQQCLVFSMHMVLLTQVVWRAHGFDRGAGHAAASCEPLRQVCQYQTKDSGVTSAQSGYDKGFCPLSTADLRSDCKP